MGEVVSYDFSRLSYDFSFLSYVFRVVSYGLRFLSYESIFFQALIKRKVHSLWKAARRQRGRDASRLVCSLFAQGGCMKLHFDTDSDPFYYG